jgi:RNA-binding protein YhbY
MLIVSNRDIDMREIQVSKNQHMLQEEESRRLVMKERIQVFTPIWKREDAEEIAHALVQKRLAGCIQIIGPTSSTYRWKSRI